MKILVKSLPRPTKYILERRKEMLHKEEEDMEVVSANHTCAYHKEHPEDKAYPGCTCHGIWTYKKREQGHEEERR